MIALGHVAAAVTISLVAVGILLGVERLEVTFKALRRGVHAWRSALAWTVTESAGSAAAGGAGPGAVGDRLRPDEAPGE